MGEEEVAREVLQILRDDMRKQTENSTLMVEKLESIDKKFDDVISKYHTFSRTMTKIEAYMITIIGILIAFGAAYLLT